MSEEEFEVLVGRLGQDISYMGLKLQQEADHCSAFLRKSNDIPKYLQKIASILKNFSQFSRQFAINIEERIETAGLTDQYAEILKTLRAVSGQRGSLKAENLLENGVCSTVKLDDAKVSDVPEGPFLSQPDSVHIEDKIKDDQEQLTDVANHHSPLTPSLANETALSDDDVFEEATSKSPHLYAALVSSNVPSKECEPTTCAAPETINLSSDSDVEFGANQQQQPNVTTTEQDHADLDNMSINSDETVKFDGPSECDSDDTIVDAAHQPEPLQVSSSNTDCSEVFNGPERPSLDVVVLGSTSDCQSDASVHRTSDSEVQKEQLAEAVQSVDQAEQVVLSNGVSEETPSKAEQQEQAVEEDGDVSDSGTSDEASIKAHFKSKLNEKERKLLFKVIEKFYRERRTRISTSNSSSDEDEKPANSGRKKKRRKHNTAVKKTSSEAQKVVEEIDEIANCSSVSSSISTQVENGSQRIFTATTEHEDGDSEIANPFRKRKARPLPTEESESCVSTDRMAEDSKVSQSGSASDDHLKRKRSSSTSESATSQSLATKKRKTASTGDDSASSFCMDSQARNDLLDMLVEHNLQSTNESTAEEKTEETQEQYQLGEGDRDNLLEMLVGRPQGSDDGQIELDEAREDALLKTDSDEEENKQSDRDGGCKPFKFTETQRSALLDLLSGIVEDEVLLSDTDSAPESLVDATTGQKLEKVNCRRAVGKVSREVLDELLNEFEATICQRADATNAEVTTGPDQPADNSEKGSDNEDDLLDVLREEVIDKTDDTKRRRGRPRKSLESWNAYSSLLESNDDISDSSSSVSDVDLDSMLSGQDLTEPQQIPESSYYFKKELMVKVARMDLSGFDLSRFQNRQTRSGEDSDDRLCNLGTIFQEGRHSLKAAVRSRTKRISSSSHCSASSSLPFDLQLSELSDSQSVRQGSEPPGNHSDDDGHLAKSLWDSIYSSGDEARVSSSDESSSGKRRLEDKSHISSSDDLSGSEQEKETIENKMISLDSSDEGQLEGRQKQRPAWWSDPLLRADSFSNSDSQDEGRNNQRKRKKSRFSSVLSDSDESIVVEQRRASPEESDDSDFEIIEKQKTPEKAIVITDDEEETPTKKGKGRRNIRALVEDDDLEEATQRANNEERERIRRLQERDKSKEHLSQSQGCEEDEDPLVLDALDDVEVKVHPSITRKLKPHQRMGIQFMWDSCYESIKQLNDGYVGSGCILAHCMGLGKTLQALGLIEVLFRTPITKTKHVLVVCPLSTVSNWRNEFNLAYGAIRNLNTKLFTIESKKDSVRKFHIVTKWRRKGGVLVLGYESFGLMINEQKLSKLEKHGVNKTVILQALVNPGPDLVICDEGHLLRNKQSLRTLAMNQIRTKRRIVLTGTPLQNNLLEYYCMVNFVKPNLLGTAKEYKTNFSNPITNGQFEDSTAEDIMFMKKRTHVLHKILNRTVQRVEDTELKQYLPKLIDQAVFVQLSDLQVSLYNTYLDSMTSRPISLTKSGTINRKYFLSDVQVLQYICSHPNVLTTAENTARSKIKEQDVIEDNLDVDIDDRLHKKGDWHKELLSLKGTTDLSLGSKVLVAIDIVREAAAAGDKVLIFAHSYAEMHNLELFLTQCLQYTKNVDYYRMDGTIIPEVRGRLCDKFNNPANTRVKAFIVSTRVGGLGLNLTAANRIIIMNVSWNPSNDTQSVFRAFRFGQAKAVFVYRLIAIDTMEEKMYQRVVTKLAVAHRVVDKHQITRHYTAADIQEYYAVRPTINRERPVPNVPEDRVLANLIQKHHVVFRWHEHQTLLANRPEEDLDEQQKNAAWEEFNNKASVFPALPVGESGALANQMVPGNAPIDVSQPGPSGLQARFNSSMVSTEDPRRPGLRNKRFSVLELTEIFNRLPTASRISALKARTLPQPNISSLSRNLDLPRQRPVVAGNNRNGTPPPKSVPQTYPDLVLNPASTHGLLAGRPAEINEASATNTVPATTYESRREVERINSLIRERLRHRDIILPAETTIEATTVVPEDFSAMSHPDHSYSLPKTSLFPVRISSLHPVRRVSPPSFRPVFATRLLPFSSPRLFSGTYRGRKRALLVARVSSADEFTALPRPTPLRDVTKPERKLNPVATSKKSVISSTSERAEVPVTSPGLRSPISSPLNLSRPRQTANSPPINSVPKISSAEAPPTLPTSPLQQQMRKFMDHLHQLQLRMKKNKPTNAAEVPSTAPGQVRSGLPLLSNARKHGMSGPSGGFRSVLTSRLPTPNSVVPLKRPPIHPVIPSDGMWKIASKPVLAKKGTVSNAQPVRSVQPLRVHRVNSHSSSKEIKQSPSFSALLAGTSQVSSPSESPHYKTLQKIKKLPIRVTAVPNPNMKRKLSTKLKRFRTPSIPGQKPDTTTKILAAHNPLSTSGRRPEGNQENRKRPRSPIVIDLST